MELCPISNALTNMFCHSPQIPAHDGRARDPQLRADDRSTYPLLAFLREGLDVCINTDNRWLHSRHRLSDEYLAAARLCNGLSKWDVLKICKAGFKSAFLPKDKIASLLRHVEYEVFKISSENSGELEFPVPERMTLRIQQKKTARRKTGKKNAAPALRTAAKKLAPRANGRKHSSQKKAKKKP